MRSIPVDTMAVAFKAVEVTPKTDREGTQKVNFENVPQWTIQCMAVPLVGKAELVDVTVAARTAPELAVLAEIDFTGLVARSWEMAATATTPARFGISFSAKEAA